MSEPVALRIASWTDAVELQFRTGPERDRFLGYSGIIDELTLLFAPNPSAHNKTGGNRTERVHPHFRFVVNYSLDLNGRVPRFGPVEVEGVLDGDVLRIDLPDLHEMPWPKCWGHAEAEQWVRTARERLAYGLRRGKFQTQMQAAVYLRDPKMPDACRDVIRPPAIWYSLMEELKLPVR